MALHMELIGGFPTQLIPGHTWRKCAQKHHFLVSERFSRKHGFGPDEEAILINTLPLLGSFGLSGTHIP